MGVILSLIVEIKDSIQNSRDRKKAKKNPNQATVAPAATAPAQPSAPSQTHEAVERLQDEHSASVPPPTTEATQGVGTVERNIAVEAPLPVSTTAPITQSASVAKATTTDTTTSEGVESTEKGTMASDEDYASFLDKANEDPNKGVAKTKTSGKIQLKAVDQGVKIPAALKEATNDAFYVSDADEPFEPVVLKGVKGLPDEETFAKLVDHPSPKNADVSIMDIGEWDSQGQYKELVDVVRKETKGSDVRVYRIARDGTRVEYFVVGVEGGKLVGVKALAIES